MGARIVNALDALDALTSERSYRHALSQSQALVILEDNAGEQFDPHVVNTIVELVESDNLVFQDYSKEPELDILFTFNEIEEVLNTQ